MRHLIAVLVCLLALETQVSAAIASPPATPPFEGKWIFVDLDTYQALAYDGRGLVYRAPITSGKPGWDTDLGTYRIYLRVASQTMDSATVGIPRDSREGWYLPNVVFNQYFLDNMAIHGNYWQSESVFGSVNTSHGCIGMRNQDARVFWDFAELGTPIVVNRGQSVTVPAVAAMSVEDAAAALSAAGFAVGYESLPEAAPAGLIARQQPPAGARVAPGTLVTLSVPGTLGAVTSALPAQAADTVTVPDIVGRSETQARQMLTQARLSVRYVNYQSEDDVEPGSRWIYRQTAQGGVLSASQPSGSRVPSGSAIDIAVRK